MKWPELPARLHAHLYQAAPVTTLAITPRMRLCRGPYVGIGFAWLTAWLHVWIWQWNGPCGTYAYWRERGGGMIELLPYVWLHWNRHGAGVHVWFVQWKWHCWFWERAT